MDICCKSPREDFEEIRLSMENIFLCHVAEILCRSPLYNKYIKDSRFFFDIRGCYPTGTASVYVIGEKKQHTCCCGRNMYLSISPAEESWYGREYPEDGLKFVGVWRCPLLRVWNTHKHDVCWDRVLVSKKILWAT